MYELSSELRLVFCVTQHKHWIFWMWKVSLSKCLWNSQVEYFCPWPKLWKEKFVWDLSRCEYLSSGLQACSIIVGRFRRLLSFTDADIEKDWWDVCVSVRHSYLMLPFKVVEWWHLLPERFLHNRSKCCSSFLCFWLGCRRKVKQLWKTLRYSYGYSAKILTE